ncbi:Arm DNA-binding domain-containing protein [Neisseria sp. Ec49-e6-T10]|uniref:Arm DNA-binding domain-containing protein n=1 Tax=Neisseria sp. Ec49-e6-T10 TaxID=3140744 RepID=UPI003EC0E6BA
MFRYKLNKITKTICLGPLSLVSLSEARNKAFDCRKLLLEGVCPHEHKLKQKRQQQLAQFNKITFAE